MGTCEECLGETLIINTTKNRYYFHEKEVNYCYILSKFLFILYNFKLDRFCALNDVIHVHKLCHSNDVA